jgi:hypothetical protein
MPSKQQTAREAAMAAMAAMVKPAAAPEPEAPAPKRPARQRPARAQLTAAPMPAEQSKPPLFEKRFTLPLTPEQWGALTDARRADGVEGTWRIRAMIALWQEDPKIRARVDKLAKAEADRDKRARGYRR